MTYGTAEIANSVSGWTLIPWVGLFATTVTIIVSSSSIVVIVIMVVFIEILSMSPVIPVIPIIPIVVPVTLIIPLSLFMAYSHPMTYGTAEIANSVSGWTLIPWMGLFATTVTIIVISPSIVVIVSIVFIIPIIDRSV